MILSSVDLAARARRAADSGAADAGVVVHEAEVLSDFRQASELWGEVWGRTNEGVPLNSELLRSLSHAGGVVTVARDTSARVVGAAALVLSQRETTYSLIAAVRVGAADRGIGRALKLRQRAWALERGLTVMTWTFDPLVARNARFNLTKLGAIADEYVVHFYDKLADELNGGDDADRLVAHWQLDGATVRDAGEGNQFDYTREPPSGPFSVQQVGPDGHVAYFANDKDAWCRVPYDVVTLRRTDPEAAVRWRHFVRGALEEAFERGMVATEMTRACWYRLSVRNSHET